MRRGYKCCPNCYETIDRHDSQTAYIWAQLCGYSIATNSFLKFKINHDVNGELKLLEELGFVDSHETLDELLIRVNGCFIDEELSYCFCIDDNGHEDDEDDEEE